MGTMCTSYAIFLAASDSIPGSVDFELWSHIASGMGIRAYFHMSTDYREIDCTTPTICV